MREPDWQALADLQFLLYNRIADSLNAALSSIALSDMPEAQDRPPGFWKERATIKISNVLNLFTAWSYLIRFKLGESLPDRAIRPFHVNTLLAWLGAQLQISPPPVVKKDILLHANQDTLQEALMLLYSVAFTQGTGVHLALEVSSLGAWFRVKFNRSKPLPASMDSLLESFGDHWRAQDAAFELYTARDFVRLNGCDLLLNPKENAGEFAFFVPAKGARAQTDAPQGAARTAVAADMTRMAAPEIPLDTAVLDQTGPLDPSATTTPTDPLPDVIREMITPLVTPTVPPLPSAESMQDDSAPGAPAVPTTPESQGWKPLPVLVVGEDEKESIDEEPVAPPTLAALRPRPSSAQADTPQPSAEGAAQPGELADSAQRDGQASASPEERDTPSEITVSDRVSETPSTRRDLTPGKRPAPAAALPGTTIVPAKIPDPVLPARLRTPPAATSNVALTRDTQTLTPVSTPPASDASAAESDTIHEERT